MTSEIPTSMKGSDPAIDNSPTNFLSPLINEAKALATEYRIRKNSYKLKGIHPADVPTEEAKGWEVQRHGKRITRLKRLKSHDKLLEDQVWCLLYGMGYPILNGANFKIAFQREDNSIGTKQVDVYAEDDETTLVVECKSRVDRGRRSLQKDIQETISLREYFREAINKRFNNKAKPKSLIQKSFIYNNALRSS